MFRFRRFFNFSVVHLHICCTISIHYYYTSTTTTTTNNNNNSDFLYQRISVLIQRYNEVLLHDGLPDDSTD